MDKLIKPVHGIGGTIRVPGDKSISHRALILGALCDGEVVIENLSPAADCAATASCLQKMGVQIEAQANGRRVVSGRGRSGFCEPQTILDAGNSGTTMRLLCGVLAALPYYAVLTGDDSLCQRPMKRITEPLSQMGARISGRERNSKPPLTITGGKLSPITYTMPIASAQVKSAILLAGLFCDGETRVIEKTVSRDHTERMLTHLGANLHLHKKSITIKGGDLTPQPIYVPGDLSSAFYFILAAVLAPGSEIIIENVGLNPTRIGGLRVLQAMGAEIKISQTEIKNGEPCGTITASSSRLTGINIGAAEIPSLVDEIPALALAATQAEGTTVISGARELRFKESDRLATVAAELTKLGATITAQDDGLTITGPTRLRGTVVESHHDHRLAMTTAVAGLLAAGETLIGNAESVAVSFPGFFELLQEVRG